MSATAGNIGYVEQVHIFFLIIIRIFFALFFAIVVVVVVVVVDINSPNVGTPRLRVEQIFNVTIRTTVLM